MLMKCIKCGTELSEGMAFCPTCGAAQSEGQNAGNGSFGNNQQSQQQWQSQQPYGQQQFQSQQQWQQQPYEQQSYGQQPQQNQGWNQNNPQGMAGMQKKKSSKAPLIIGLAAAIIIIIGLAVTCIILITSDNSSSKNNIKNSNSNGSSVSKASTAEDTVKAFLEALVDGDYSTASEYMLPEIEDYIYREVDVKSVLKEISRFLAGYEINDIEKFSKNELKELNYELDYSEEITDAAVITVDFFGEGACEEYEIYVVKTDKWYIADIG